MNDTVPLTDPAPGLDPAARAIGPEQPAVPLVSEQPSRPGRPAQLDADVQGSPGAPAGRDASTPPTAPLDPGTGRVPTAQLSGVPAPTSPLTPAPAAEPEPPEPVASPERYDRRPPLRILLTILHLSAYGVVGFGLIGTLFGVLGTGIALIFVIGVGLVVLVALVYALFGIAWFEAQRVAGLYELDVPPLRLVPARSPGFKGWLGAVCRQSIDGRMWRSLANFGLSSVMGALVLFCAQGAVHGVVYALSSGRGADFVALVGSVLALAVIVGTALLHRLLSIAIIPAGVHEKELTERAAQSAQQREGAVRAADLERTRIERDLHDGVQPRLVSVGMTLGLAQQKIDDDPEAAKALVAEAHTSTKAAITELRQLARGIYASVLDDRGLDAALSALAARSHIPVQLDVRMSGRCSRDAEAAVYFAIAESLTNAAKHSRAGECRVVVRMRDDGATLWARVEDNGIGGARVVPGGGLDGIINRIIAAGGTTALDSPQGGPTALEVSVPCAS